MTTKGRKVKPSTGDQLLDIDLDADPTETIEGKEGLNTLVSTVSDLFKVDEKKKISKRNEPSIVFGELGLSTNKQDKIEMHHLLNSVIDKSGKIKRQIRKITHKKLLPLPVNSTQAKKIERQVLYDETVKDVSKWEPIINQNREAAQLSFPLEKPQLNMQTIQEQFNLKICNPLKAEVDALLASSSNVLKKDKVLTDTEEKYLNQMTIEEARIRHAKLQKMRALISYQEAKLKRKAKIKSKKYHRILKKEKLRKDLKEFEELKKKNPDAALEKLNQLDKMRALERASLKHLNSGKWAKQNLLRAKYDPKTREDIREQMNLNKTLLQKAIFNVEEEEDDDGDDDNDFAEDLGEGEVMMASDGYEDKKSEPNPWLIRNAQAPLLSSSDIIQENETDAGQSAQDDEPEKEITPAEEIELVKQAIQTKKSKTLEEVKPKKMKEPVKVEIKEKKGKEQEKAKVKPKKTEKDEEKEKSINNDNDLMINPNKILITKSRVLQTTIPDYQEMGVDADSDNEEDALMSDDDDGQRKLIAEAFDEDDVVAEFIQDKKDQIDKEEGKDIDTFLPGWGSWTGPGLRTNKRNRSKFIIKAKRRNRKDSALPNVIISENKDKAISKFMIKEMPHYFKNVGEFENKFKKPIGPNWNSESQFRFNVEPRVITQLGKIIEPINEKALKKLANKRRPLDQVVKTLADVIPV